MKMPEKQSKDSGIYDCQENQYCNEELENNAIEEINAPAENDFSEYLWMENEEEFDKEVMQRLEEEALMEECIEAFLNDENNIPNGTNTNNPSPQSGNQVAQETQEKPGSSKLNPEAAEFVPLSRRPNPEPPSSTSSS